MINHSQLLEYTLLVAGTLAALCRDIYIYILYMSVFSCAFSEI